MAVKKMSMSILISIIFPKMGLRTNMSRMDIRRKRNRPLARARIKGFRNLWVMPALTHLRLEVSLYGSGHGLEKWF
jgi:hypothetical protein